ncbi:GDSL-type esterase/lipase family protein [Caulobacter sp. LARHSG274]
MRAKLWVMAVLCMPTAMAVLCAPTALLGQEVRVAKSTPVVTKAMRTLPVHVGGRVSISPLSGPLPGGAKRYLHQWPGVYFETSFSGDMLVLKFDDPYNEYRLSIDGQPPQRIAQPGAFEYSVTGLPAGLHHVHLEKVTESIDHSASFDGFYAPPSARIHRIEPRARRIEFIGDSGMTGYGIRSETRACTQEEVRLRSDAQIAYPALVAKRLDADYQVNAISGRGLIRNYGGQWPDDTMLHAYRYAVRERGLLYRDNGWRPQVMFVMLGANDFYGDVKAGERWTSLPVLAKEWTEAFAQFVIGLHRQTPDATIIVGWPDMAVQTDADVIRMYTLSQESIEAATQREGIRKLSFLSMMPGLKPQNSACDYHASAEDHRQIAAYVTKAVETLTGWRAH